MSKKLTQEYIIMKLKNDRIQTIKNLNLWGNDLEDVSILQQMPSLEIISLSVNKIRSLKPFANLHNLRELYLRKNMVGDITEIKYLATCPNLRTLWLNENPIAETRNYRANVIRLLPSLYKLDDIVISDKERGSPININSNDYNELYQQQDDYIRNYANLRKQSSENINVNHSPSYDKQLNAQPYHHQEYYNNNNIDRNDNGSHIRRHPSYENKGYNDDYNIGRGNKQPHGKFDYDINDSYNYNYQKQNEYKYDNKPSEIYSSRERKQIPNSRISNVTNCLLMLLKELNTNELEYVKGEIDKRINK